MNEEEMISKLEQLLNIAENLINENKLTVSEASEEISNKLKQKLANYDPSEIQEELKIKIDNYIEKTYGYIPKITIVETKDDYKKITGELHKEFQTVLKYAKLKIPVMIIGPSGSGKNYLAKQIAETMNLPFYYSSSITQEFQLTGFIDANGNYQKTPFYDVCKNGGVFLLDEVDASVPEALINLNSALANGYFNFPNENVQIHENAIFIAAGNTFGNGGDRMYVGRNQLDISSIDRFAVVELDYDESLERKLVNDDTLFSFIKNIRETVKNTSMRNIISMRASIYARKAIKSFTKEEIIKQIILKNMSYDDMRIIFSNMKDMNYNEYYLTLKTIVNKER